MNERSPGRPAHTKVPSRSDTAPVVGPASWLWLLLAGITETAWIVGVKNADSLLAWAGTALAVAASLAVALRATRGRSVTTVYVMFVALGTVGASVVQCLSSAAAVSAGQAIWLVVLIGALVGLKTCGEA